MLSNNKIILKYNKYSKNLFFLNINLQNGTNVVDYFLLSGCITEFKLPSPQAIIK